MLKHNKFVFIQFIPARYASIYLLVKEQVESRRILRTSDKHLPKELMPKNKSIGVDKARKFLNSNGEKLRKKYGLDGYAIGYKTKQGRYTNTLALIFYVKKKKTTKELASENLEQIPEEIDGIPTDVVAKPKGIEPRQ